MVNNKWFKIISYIFFFFNGVGLPFGLLYTTILSPIFYFKIVLKKANKLFIIFLLLIFPFIIIQILSGVVLFYYIKSLLLFIAVIVVAISLYAILPKLKNIDELFRKLIIYNFAFAIIALIFFNSWLGDLLWSKEIVISENITATRLMLLTYEPSYYSTLLAPLFIYSFLKLYQNFNKTNFAIFFIIVFPLILSFSFGMISMLLFSLTTIVVKDQWKNKNNLFILVSILILIIVLFSTNNPFAERVMNVFSGADVSVEARTFYSFYYAWEMIVHDHFFFGYGFGQLKVVGLNFIHWGTLLESVRLPNNIAEFMVTVGILGTFLKIFLEIFLFYKTKVYSNMFTLAIFLTVFILQFTGSYMTSTAEYILWVLAFSPIFREFNFNRRKKDFIVNMVKQ